MRPAPFVFDRPGVLRDYTLGSDGLYRRRVEIGGAVEISVRDARGRKLRVERIALDAVGRPQVTTSDMVMS